MSLITSVRTELAARKGDWPDICKHTGVSYSWLTKFAQGRNDNPGVKTLEKLQVYFKKSPRSKVPA